MMVKKYMETYFISVPNNSRKNNELKHFRNKQMVNTYIKQLRSE